MSVNKYNSEGYYDPTAYEALTIIDREISQRRYTRPRRYMPKVYICSPFRGDVANNVIKTRAYCSFAVKQGRIPYASHLLFPQFMSDSDLQAICYFRSLCRTATLTREISLCLWRLCILTAVKSAGCSEILSPRV